MLAVLLLAAVKLTAIKSFLLALSPQFACFMIILWNFPSASSLFIQEEKKASAILCDLIKKSFHENFDKLRWEKLKSRKRKAKSN